MPKLTNRVVDPLQSKDKEYFVWDDELPGFGLRVLPTSNRNPKGIKTFILQYRNSYGDQRRLKLGRLGILSPQKAQEKARSKLALIADGNDPQQDQRDHKDADTINQLADRYMVDHAMIHKKPRSVESDETLLRLHIRPALGELRVEELSRREITKLHHGMKATPGAANRTLALLSKMMNLSEKWGLRTDGSNPCRHVEKYHERRMERFLSEKELANLGEVLAEAERTQTEMPSVIAAIRLLIFTGARTGEILNLRWEQVDFDNGWLNLPESKSGAKLVYLSPSALDLLSSIERSDDSPWVIQGRDKGKPLVNIRKPWGRIRKRAGMEDVRLHDLRHSFASFGVAHDLSLPMIGALLGHSQPATTARYAHLAADPMRKAATVVGEHIAASMKPKDSAGEILDLEAHKK